MPNAVPVAVPGLVWGLPFVGVLLSIALFPILAPRLWRRRMGVVCAICIMALVVPQVAVAGPVITAAGVWHAVLTEYLPFVTLLLALFAAGGGILLQGGPGGTPGGNTAILALGTVMAGVMGHDRRSDGADPSVPAVQCAIAVAGCIWWCSSSSSSPMPAVRSLRWATARCTSASCSACPSAGRC